MSNRLLIQIDRDELEELVAAALQKAMTRNNGADLPELMTRREVADFLGVSTGTIDGYCRAGKLTKHYVGPGDKMPRFRRADVVKFAGFYEKYGRD
jgi:hypothetical protein